MPIKLGFVGLSQNGWASKAVAQSLFKAPLSNDYNLVAVSTTREESAVESAKYYGQLAGKEVKAYWGDTSKVAGDQDVDMVAVSVKASGHYAALLPAINAGKDIFVEWPAGRNLGECAELAAAAERKGVRSLVGLQGRQSLVPLKVREIISSGKIGKVLSSSVTALVPRELGYWGPAVNEAMAHTLDSSLGSSMNAIMVGHFLGTVMPALGSFTSVSATAINIYSTAELLDSDGKKTGRTATTTDPDHIAFNAALKSGGLFSALFRGGVASTPGRKHLLWIIDGEDGCIKVESDAFSGSVMHIRDPELYLNGEKIEVPGDGVVGNATRIWHAFAQGKRDDYASLDDAVEVHRVLEAIIRSAREGKTVSLD